jgi:hypothetical protein
MTPFGLLCFTLDRNGRAWKGFDWSAMNRLRDKGMIQNPAGKAKWVVLLKRVSLNHSCSPRQFDVPRRGADGAKAFT